MKLNRRQIKKLSARPPVAPRSPHLAGYRVTLRSLFLGALISLLCLPASFAINNSPTLFLNSVFSDLVTELKQIKGTPSEATVQTLFSNSLSPHIDYPGLARWTLRDHWTQSSEAQQFAFLRALESHLIKTYASALSFDRHSALRLNDDVTQGKHLTTVTGQLSTAGASNTAVRFRLVSEQGNWRLFDVGVHGISVAKTLRADFAAIASRGGIDAVTAALGVGDLRLVSARH